MIEKSPALKKQLAEDLRTEIKPWKNPDYKKNSLYKYIGQLGYTIDGRTKALIAI
jgi:hypothetical protein